MQDCGQNNTDCIHIHRHIMIILKKLRLVFFCDFPAAGFISIQYPPKPTPIINAKNEISISEFTKVIGSKAATITKAVNISIL